MRVNPLIRMRFGNIRSRLDDVSAAVIVIGTYALFVVMLLGFVSAYS